MSKFNLLAAVGACLFCIVATSVGATVTYTYTGNNFDTFENISGNNNPYDTTMNVMVTLEFTEKLPPDTPLHFVTPDRFIISDGINSIDSANAYNSHIRIGTDSDGNIDRWFLFLQDGSAAGLDVYIETIGNYANFYFDMGQLWTTTDQYKATIMYAPGSWDVGLLDTDSDGVSDTLDNCPDEPNPIQACTSASDCLGPTNICNAGFCSEQNNNDGDASGDVCDVDDDNDGWNDDVDNCPLVANSGQEDADYDGLGDACDGTFTTNSAVIHVTEEASGVVDTITYVNLPGGNGLIAKLTGEGGVVSKVDNAVSAYDSGLIDLETYLSELEAALDMLDAFDNQLSAKINNGKIVEPEATQLIDASAEIRETINNLIVGVGG